MRFTLIDRIVELEKGASITAVKTVSLSEDYLKDHFPRFPVLPGVFMLEAMTQASAWLIRISEDFAHSIVVLKEAHNVKYADFVAPGQVLSVMAEVKEQGQRETKLVARGSVDGLPTVSARLVLERFNLADTNPEELATDNYIKSEMRKMLTLLYCNDRLSGNRKRNDKEQPQKDQPQNVASKDTSQDTNNVAEGNVVGR